jgi:hypothetical protein
VQALGEGVDDGDADAVQAAGHLVAATVAELAAGVQDGQHDFDGRALLLLVQGDRNAAAVVAHRDGVVRVDDDVDGRAMAGERLVDRVVDDLVHEMVQAPHAGRADVHAGTLAHRLEAFEDGDVLGVVAAGVLFCPLDPSLAKGPPCERPGGGHGLMSTAGAREVELQLRIPPKPVVTCVKSRRNCCKSRTIRAP